jgi:hypothetical protein
VNVIKPGSVFEPGFFYFFAWVMKEGNYERGEPMYSHRMLHMGETIPLLFVQKGQLTPQNAP